FAAETLARPDDNKDSLPTIFPTFTFQSASASTRLRGIDSDFRSFTSRNRLRDVPVQSDAPRRVQVPVTKGRELYKVLRHRSTPFHPTFARKSATSYRLAPDRPASRAHRSAPLPWDAWPWTSQSSPSAAPPAGDAPTRGSSGATSSVSQ